MIRLERSFYNRTDVLTIARELLGKIIVTQSDDQFSAGRIVETEAYAGVTDKASHAYGGRRTARTEVMYHQPGTAYVYLCYGIHHLFNIVTNEKDVPHAILVRAIEPVAGIPLMLARTGKKKADHSLGRGPGVVSKALGISTRDTGTDLTGDAIYIAEDDFIVTPEMITATPRVGVDYAGADALLPYRFFVKDNRYVSRGGK